MTKEAQEICERCAYGHRAPMICPIPDGRRSPDCAVYKKLKREQNLRIEREMKEMEWPTR